MPLKKIITVPSETLRKISEPLENVGKEEKNLLRIYLKLCTTIKELVLQQSK